jgi:hypothetical protein
LPQSQIGKHTKVYSLLSDPAITAKLQAYVHLNKWAMDPEKLAKLSKDELVPKVAKNYLQLITREDIPYSLKRYMELKLFPWIHLHVGCGISLMTAH